MSSVTKIDGVSQSSMAKADVRLFQLHLVDQGFTSNTLNVTITGLAFFFEVTVHHPELMAGIFTFVGARHPTRNRVMSVAAPARSACWPTTGAASRSSGPTWTRCPGFTRKSTGPAFV
ncbi:hypothetical protein [Massilia pseudoviolaceinigra]|uniref:hypothetical protein n=1 Tax=Massilia pseudoviolaceinigra TaxID=3057165 RepID=UPI0027967A97|nr:hypothetical protein [Massilia sp. CCM 9206]MDQ1919255.1 hypothetical protein [Massilia sp. CCM 9206]